MDFVRLHSVRASEQSSSTNTFTSQPSFLGSETEYESALGASLDDLNAASDSKGSQVNPRSAPVPPSRASQATAGVSNSEFPLVDRVVDRAAAAQQPVEEIDDNGPTPSTTQPTAGIVVDPNRAVVVRRTGKRVRARKAAKAMSKPIRKSYIGMVAGLASTIGLGQAIFLKATYESPPDARGPRSGVERPRIETLASSQGHVSRVVPQSDSGMAQTSSAGAAQSTRDAVNVAIDAAVESMRGELSTMDLSPTVQRSGGKLVKRHKRILIVGDSLVSGVGGLSSFNDGPSDGPALPRSVARYLSEMLNVDVQWNAMSLTGGDVRMLKRKIVPMLTREKERGTIGDISAVVLVTGVNDWKRISPFRTASKFKEDLQEFIEKTRDQVGEDVKVFLPAIPGVYYSPRFHEPLRSIVTFLNDYWDSQKLQLSRSMKGVYFVGQPPSHEWGSNPIQFFSTLDRVHPSELGYQRWAERIAEHMVAAFRKSMAMAANSTSTVMTTAAQRASTAACSAIEHTGDAAEATTMAAASGQRSSSPP